MAWRSFAATCAAHSIVPSHEQLNRRLPLVRLNLATAVLTCIAQLPAGRFFERHNTTILGPEVRPHPQIRLSAGQYDALRAVAAGSVLAWGLGVRRPAVGYTAAASFATLNGYVANFVPGLWSYNSQLNFHLAAASLVAMHPVPEGEGRSATGRTSDSARATALLYMQLSTTLVYTQAGLSKLLYGAQSWLRTGDTLAGSLAVLGTPRGRALSKRSSLHPWLSRATVAAELAFLPALILGWRRRGALSAGAAAFHLATSRYLDISFWHLWSLFPGLFWPTDRSELAAPVGRGRGTGTGGHAR